MEFTHNKNIISVSSNGSVLNFGFLKNNCVRVFVEKAKTDLIELSIKKASKGFSFDEKSKTITFGKYQFKLNDDLSYDLYCESKFVTSFGRKEEMIKEDLNYEFTFSLNNESKVYGLGDKMAQLNKRGLAFRQWNTDDSNHQDELFPALYKSINYMLVNTENKYFGIFFPSTFPYAIDIGKENLNVVKVASLFIKLDYFLFLGENPTEITSNYSSMVGHPFMIRLKMLGNNQSRWSYKNEEEVMGVVNNFEKNQIPLDYIHLDIHYMDGYRDFTVDKTRFPNMKAMTKACNEKGIEIVAINDAGLKLDPEYKDYKFCKDNNLISKIGKEDFVGTVWPGDAVFPKYYSKVAREYFAKSAEQFIKDNGLSGLWNDMNEPASFKGELPNEVDFSVPGRKINNIEEHNVYGEHMIRCFKDIFKSQNLRPYVFSRAAFATTPKYAFAWNGDNFSLWHHLRLSLPQIMSMSLSGNMFNGVDVGGFGGDTTKELLIRWVEANALMPFVRNHSTLDSKFQEPYSIDEETVKIYKKYIELRYELIPYLYDLAKKMNEKGEPIVKPLFFAYPEDEQCKGLSTQYMVGDSIMVAPILGQEETSRIVYFPKGKWIDFETGETFKGDKEYIVKIPLDKTGIYVKENSIIPTFKPMMHIEKEAIDTLVLKIFGNKGKYNLYEDDGKSLNYLQGESNRYSITYKNHQLSIKCVKDGYKTPFKHIEVIANGKTIKTDFKKDLVLNLQEAFK